MYMNIKNLKLGEVLAVECFLSQFGYDVEVERKKDDVILNLDKLSKKQLEYEEEVEVDEKSIVFPIREI